MHLFRISAIFIYVKRKVVNKPNKIVCEICSHAISAYGLPSHIRNLHKTSVEDYIKKYGEFRKQRPISSRNIKLVCCGLCGGEFSSVGMFVHLRDTHHISPDDYVKIHPEYRPSKIRQLNYVQRLSGSEKVQKCVICDRNFASGNLLGWHVKNEHKLSKQDYILKYIFKGVHPTCKCGCGRQVKVLKYYPYCREYISSHNPNAMLGRRHSKLAKEKMSLKAMERLSDSPSNKIDTEPELKFAAFLKKIGENYVHPHQTDCGLVDFYLPDSNLLVEIDGEYWHPEKIEGLNFRLLPNVISAKRKSSLQNLIRIRERDVDKLYSVSDLQRMNTIYDFEIGFRQKIIFKEFFESCLELKGEKYLRENVWLLLKFLRELHPDFPFPPNEESPSDVISFIASYNFDSVFDPVDRTFSNNISNSGMSWLKSHFKSFWKSSFKGNKSPIEAWQDDAILKQVISYRIGLNNSGEVFDFSLHQIIRGLSARRMTVSFFKPLLAASIYDYYLKGLSEPVVFDPCCGFGGRLVGFKSRFPNGKYIGCEPNPETYNELCSLVQNMNWENIEIYNCPIEDFDIPIQADIVFTSIPYYNLEKYSHRCIYTSFESWNKTFIAKICSLAQTIPTFINMPSELAVQLGFRKIDSYIASNRSHFDRSPGLKLEPILKL